MPPGDELNGKTDLKNHAAVKNPLVILPTYNEADNIASLLDALLSLPRPVRVLVVDDASPDRTADRVQAHPRFNRSVFLLSRNSKQGLGTAYRAGFRWALERGHDACIQMDADWSHDPDTVPRLLSALEAGADLALGSRYVSGGSIVNWPLRRLWLSRMGALYSRFWTGIPQQDPTGGFKAIRKSVLASLEKAPLNYDGYGFQVGMLFNTVQSGYQITEVPIVFTERRNGRSKMSLAVVLEAILKIPLLRLQFFKPPFTGTVPLWSELRLRPALKDDCE